MVVWNQNHKSMRYACMYFLLFHRFTEKRKTTPIPDKLPLWRSHHKSLWIPGPQRISEFCSQIHPSGRSEETVRKWGLETQKWKTGFFFFTVPWKTQGVGQVTKGSWRLILCSTKEWPCRQMTCHDSWSRRKWSPRKGRMNQHSLQDGNRWS